MAEKKPEEYTPEELQKLPQALNRRLCLQEMKNVITQIGPTNINKNYYSKRYGRKWRTIDTWFTNLLNEIPVENVANIRVIGDNAMRQNLAVCERILMNAELRPSERLMAIRTRNDTIDKYTKFLEAYGLKEKIADKLEVDGMLDVQRLMSIAQKKEEEPEETKEGDDGTDA